MTGCFCYNTFMKRYASILIIFVTLICFILYSINISRINTEKIDFVNANKSHTILSYHNDILCSKTAANTGVPLRYIYAMGHISDDSNDKIYINNNAPINYKKFNRLLEYVKNENFVILNRKSHKYHQLDCKYGRKSHNFSIIAYKKLPKECSPCKYCNNNLYKPSIVLEERITKQSPVKTEYSNERIKIFLTDHTTHLKPNLICNTKLAKEIVNQINNAQSNIDIAIYGYGKIPSVDVAIKNAILRGVKVRLIYDEDINGNNLYPDTNKLKEIVTGYNSDKNIEAQKLMHNKFFIFDNKRVLTGSANLSPHDLSEYHSNSMILINSEEIAKIFLTEFEQMYNSRFHSLKLKTKNNQIVENSKEFSIYFSPQDNAINNGILPLINNSKKYIYIPTFLITSREIANALINARSRGVEIKIIIDSTLANTRYTQHHRLRENGIKVKIENFAGKLHSKSMIVDDEYIVIGSMNYSYSGDTKNDENLIILKDKEAAIFYKKFFNYLWNRIDKYYETHEILSESKASIGSCSDGVDNDYDGLIDINDLSCK